MTRIAHRHEAKTHKKRCNQLKRCTFPTLVVTPIILLNWMWSSQIWVLLSQNKHQLSQNSKSRTQLLRFDWTRLELATSSLAQRIQGHQRNCSIPLANFRYRNRFGLGSDLHLWSQAICNSLEASFRIRTIQPWIWLDNRHCTDQSASSMTCYFPSSEMLCPNDSLVVRSSFNTIPNITRGRGRISNECQHIIASYGGSAENIQIATMTYLFSRVSPLLQSEAHRQLRKIFPGGVTPPGLITVHIRWGDKADEMKLVPIESYVAGVYEILQLRNQGKNDPVHIYLATADPNAVRALHSAVPSHWHIYTDVYVEEILPNSRVIDEYNANPHLARELSGQPGLVALGSLLVAMQANAYVLTTASNWSRLMNELRRGILDPRCNNCTLLVDLS